MIAVSSKLVDVTYKGRILHQQLFQGAYLSTKSAVHTFPCPRTAINEIRTNSLFAREYHSGHSGVNGKGTIARHGSIPLLITYDSFSTTAGSNRMAQTNLGNSKRKERSQAPHITQISQSIDVWTKLDDWLKRTSHQLVISDQSLHSSDLTNVTEVRKRAKQLMGLLDDLLTEFSGSIVPSQIGQHIATHHRNWLVQWSTLSAAYIDHIAPQRLSYLINVVSKLGFNPDDYDCSWVRRYLTRTQQAITAGDIKPSGLALIIASLGKLGINPNNIDKGFLEAWLSSSECLLQLDEQSGGFSSHDLRSIISGFAKLLVNPDSLHTGYLCSWLSASSRILALTFQQGGFSSRELNNIINSFYQLGVNPDLIIPGYLRSLLSASSKLLAVSNQAGGYGRQDLSVAIYSLSQMGVNPEVVCPGYLRSWLAACSAYQPVDAQRGGFNSQELNNIIYSWGKLGINPDSIQQGYLCSWLSASSPLLKLDIKHGGFTSQALSNIIYSFSQLDINPDHIKQGYLHSWLSASMKLLPVSPEEEELEGGFNSQGLSVVIYSWGKLGVNPDSIHPGYLSSWLSASLKFLGLDWQHGGFTGQGLSNILFSFGQLRVNPDAIRPGYLHSWLSAALPLSTLSVQSGGFSGQSISNILCGFGRLDINPDQIKPGSLPALLSAITSKLILTKQEGGLTSQQLVSILQARKSAVFTDSTNSLLSDTLKTVIANRIEVSVTDPTSMDLSELSLLTVLLESTSRAPHADALIATAMSTVMTYLLTPEKLAALAPPERLTHYFLHPLILDNCERFPSFHQMAKLILIQYGDTWTELQLGVQEVSKLVRSLALLGYSVDEYPVLFRHLKTFYSEIAATVGSDCKIAPSLLLQSHPVGDLFSNGELHRLMLFHQYILATTGERLWDRSVWDAYLSAIRPHINSQQVVSKVERSLHAALDAAKVLSTASEDHANGILPGHFIEEIVSVVDLYHPPSKTVIEIDGSVHFLLNGEYDPSTELSTRLLELFGYRVIRIRNVEKHKLTADYIQNSITAVEPTKMN